jgi:hypothetical protein
MSQDHVYCRVKCNPTGKPPKDHDFKMKKQETPKIYYVEGPDWERTVELDATVFKTRSAQLIEAASRAIETEMKKRDNFNLGGVVIVKDTRSSNREVLVNAYLCLNNVAQYALARKLREKFKTQTGQDLAADRVGYSQAGNTSR